MGASGYGGGELIRLLDAHPGFDLVYLGAHRHAGESLAEVHPQLEGGERRLQPIQANPEAHFELAFLALPHGASAPVGHQLAAEGIKVVDLGGDFRLDHPARHREAYGSDHPYPGELSEWVYGLPELFDVSAATRVAVAGCYPTATLLAIAPLLAAGLVEPTGIIADCLSGVSGAGRSLREDLLFGEVAEGVRAYSVTTHRHRPEIEMVLDRLSGSETRVTFTPHLVPIQRGLLATVTARLRREVSREDLLAELAGFYRGRPFVEVVDQPPQTRWTVSSNRALVSAFVDARQGAVVAQCALDNLLKGAAGQAVQSANLMSGLDEAEGLPRAGWMP
jgi:N-acetyl-gamma-glutamyl-phosphate reductase